LDGHLRRPFRAGRALRVVVWSSVGAELFEDVGDVGGEDGFGDVVLVGDLFAGVAKLGGGGLGVVLLVDEGGHGLAEGVRGDPFEAGVGAGLAPLSADVVR